MTTPADETTEKTPLLEEQKEEKKGFLSKVGGGIASVGKGVAGAGGSLVSGVAHGAGNVAGGLGNTLSSNYNKGCSGYDKLFLKHINITFGDHLEMASRGACFVVICALPFVLPEEICPLCQKVVRLEIYTAASITYFIYTLYVYTGDILHFAQGGIMGTFLAVFSIWCMQGFMPGGYSDTDEARHRWPVGVAWGITFVFLILWLNFDGNTRIFALSTYVWYWMAFIRPDYQAGFAQNFQIKMDGKAIKELLVAVAGCSIAVIAGYFPYPIYAHTKALALSSTMMDQIFFAKQDFLEYYVDSKKPDRLKVKILQQEIDQLSGEAGSVGGLLDSAWYECLGMGAAQRQRVMMASFQAYISDTIDLLSNAFGVGMAEDFSDKHQKLMASVKENLNTILNENGAVLQTCIACLNNAGSDEKLENEGKEHMAKAKEAVVDLTKNFSAERVKQGMDNITPDTAGENVVCLTFCQFTEKTEKFFESLLGEQAEKSDWRHGGGILGTFSTDVIMDKDHIMWTLRNGLSIILAFFAGWHGYNKYISSYNASLAGTVAVLLSNFAGSAMTKNLSRLQGVVIGIVLGNLLYAFLGWCYWWGHLLVALALYMWTLLGLFMYFHSENYSTVGLLLVVFGAQALLRPCSNDDTDPSGHGLIVNVTVAICIMTIVDLFLSQERASDMAIGALTDSAAKQSQNMKNLFGESTEVEKRKGGVLALISTAQTMGAEAYQEPRYWRTDWPKSRFDQGVACLQAVRFNMMAIENAVLEKPDDKDMQAKSEMFKLAIALDSFSNEETGLKAILLKRYIGIMKELADSLGDAMLWGKGVEADDVFIKRMDSLGDLEDGLQQGTEAWKPKYEDWCSKLNDLYQKKGAAGQPDTLRKDGLAEMSIVVDALQCIFTELDKVLDLVVA
jgi:hypothetical protein